MENTKKLKVNPLPQITWHRLRMNDSTLEFALPDRGCAMSFAGDESLFFKDGVTGSDWDGWTSMETGMGAEFDEVMREAQVTLLAAPENYQGTAPAVIRCRADGAGAEQIRIHAGKGSVLPVIVDIAGAETPEEAEAAAAVQIKLHAEEDAVIRLYVVQTLPYKEGMSMIDIGAVCEDHASIEYVSISLGAVKEYLGIAVELLGEESAFHGDLGYRVVSGQRLDINYVSRHKGKESVSQVNAWGVLEQDSWKLFRGTLDFWEGCPGSVGGEKEEVLLMGEKQVNQTIPLILCHEEDVEGNHGATISRLDANMLFYLGSRGVDTRTAENMIAQARLEAICSKIPDQEVREEAEAMIGSMDLGVETDEML